MVNRSGSTKRRLNENVAQRIEDTQDGNANITWYSSRSIASEVFTGGCDGNWGRSSGFSSAERERSGGGAPDGRPCLHAVVDTTEVLGLRGWWGLSRARVPLRSHEGSWIGRRTLWGRTFGRGAITCQRWGGMKRRSDRVHKGTRERR